MILQTIKRLIVSKRHAVRYVESAGLTLALAHSGVLAMLAITLVEVHQAEAALASATSVDTNFYGLPVYMRAA